MYVLEDVKVNLSKFTNPPVAKCIWQHLNDRRSIKKSERGGERAFRIFLAPSLGEVHQNIILSPCICVKSTAGKVCISTFPGTLVG